MPVKPGPLLTHLPSFLAFPLPPPQMLRQLGIQLMPEEERALRDTFSTSTGSMDYLGFTRFLDTAFEDEASQSVGEREVTARIDALLE